MEEGASRKPVVVSDEFKVNRTSVYDYTLDTFGYFQAERYLHSIEQALATLYNFYTAYPLFQPVCEILLLPCFKFLISFF